MKRRSVLAVVLAALLAGVPLGLVVAQLADTESVSGTMNVTADTVDLYICDLTNTGSTTATCPGIGDDSLDDELIFEGNENLRPGETQSWDLRLLNLDAVDWDLSIYAPAVTVTEVNDPGNDCNAQPTFQWRVLGKAGDDVNDNHLGSCPPGCWLGETSGLATTIHVAGGDYEDVRLRATLDLYSVGNECRENAWDISASIAATQH